jgi:hypothetical protein
VLAADRPVPAERRALVVGAVGHAVAFSTWRSLVREQGLDEAQAVATIPHRSPSPASRAAAGTSTST